MPMSRFTFLSRLSPRQEFDDDLGPKEFAPYTVISDEGVSNWIFFQGNFSCTIHNPVEII